MSVKKIVSAVAMVGLLVGATVTAAEKVKVKLEGVKCVVAPRDAKEANSAEHKKGQVYFCCGNCLAKFKEDAEPFALKANMQLVATGQYEQEACPLSGGPLNKETKIKVADAEVAFCCNNCKGKVEEAEGEAQLTLVFSEEAFKKAKFAPAKEKDED